MLLADHSMGPHEKLSNPVRYVRQPKISDHLINPCIMPPFYNYLKMKIILLIILSCFKSVSSHQDHVKAKIPPFHSNKIRIAEYL